MATGRTVSASFLTGKDLSIITLCDKISQEILNCIPSTAFKEEFRKEYGKISITRDAGLGLGGGKLQRDAMCTRGRQGKAPFSNRNFRWHPLVVADQKPDFAKSIERIEVLGQNDAQTLIFVVKDAAGKEIQYPSEKVYELPERYVALPEHWIPHIDRLKHWNDTLWTQNSCVIPALEACNWWDSIETYAVLGIALAVDLYNADFSKLYSRISGILQKQTVDRSKNLPSDIFPKLQSDFVNCPVCIIRISQGLDRFRKIDRGGSWQPAWRPSKKEEGDDSSIQVMHVNPLVEKEVKHNASNVRYGHRWCNVSMTDHSLEETLDFMEYIIRAHKRCQ